MICHHTSTKTKRYGNIDDCISCQSPIIYNGMKWVWQFDLDNTKVQKMRRAYNIDLMTEKMTEKESPTP